MDGLETERPLYCIYKCRIQYVSLPARYFAGRPELSSAVGAPSLVKSKLTNFDSACSSGPVVSGSADNALLKRTACFALLLVWLWCVPKEFDRFRWLFWIRCFSALLWFTVDFFATEWELRVRLLVPDEFDGGRFFKANVVVDGFDFTFRRELLEELVAGVGVSTGSVLSPSLVALQISQK